MEEMCPALSAFLTQFMQENITMFCVTMLFIFIDIVSGIACAIYNHNYSSTVLREGLAHKFAYILVMCSVAIIQVAMFDPQFSINFNVPLFNIVCAAIVFLELSSILENASILNPGLRKLIGKYFDFDDGDDEDIPFFMSD